VFVGTEWDRGSPQGVYDWHRENFEFLLTCSELSGRCARGGGGGADGVNSGTHEIEWDTDAVNDAKL